jgi:hypothetical protein
MPKWILPKRRAGGQGGGPIRRAGLGLFLIAIGRKEGFEDFGNTPDAYLASLAPLVAFDLVTGVLAAASGAVRMAVLVALMVLCSWLAPAVISHPLCRRWGRAEVWPRYANILNWAQMLGFLVVSLASIVAKLFVGLGVPPALALNVMFLGLVAYAIWFQWFVARNVLALSRWRTVALLLAIVIGTNLLISVPLLASGSSTRALLTEAIQQK